MRTDLKKTQTRHMSSHSSHSLIKIIIALAATLGFMPANAAGITDSYFTPNSALSSGHWVKIKVSRTGMQQVTAEQLAQMGFDDPSKVAVCGYGGTELSLQQITADTPDDVQPVPCVYDGKRIIFYGEAGFSTSARWVSDTGAWLPVNMRNYYSDYGCYFLTDTQSPVAPASVAARDTEPSKWHDTSASQVHLEKEEILPEVGARFFFADLMEEPVREFTFHLPAYRQSLPEEYKYTKSRVGLNVSVAMVVGAERSGNCIWTLPGATDNMYANYSSSRNGEVIYRDARMSSTTFASNPAPASDGNYTIKVDFSNARNPWFAAIDYINVCYRRHNDLSEGGQQRLMFEQNSNSDNARFSNMKPGTEIWDITSPRAPRVMEIKATDDNRHFVSFDRSATPNNGINTVLTAFDPETDLYEVENLGQVETQNLHAMQTPRMIIIAASSFMPQAERLAQLHRDHQGIDVAVVCQDRIYNEFSSGVPHPTGIRRFLKMLRIRKPGTLRSLLVFGATNQDNRNLRGLLNDYEGAYVPMFQNQQISSGGWLGLSYATDAVYGILSENFTVHSTLSRNLAIDMDINVGRIPASDAAQADAMVDKIEEYLSNPPVYGSFNRALLCCDSGTKNSFMEQGDETEALIRKNFPSIMTTKAYAAMFPSPSLTALIERSLTTGAGYWYYSGHSSPGGLSGSNWDVVAVENHNYDCPPFAMWATCRAAYYDHEDGVGKTALLKRRGGVIGLVAAVREVYKDPNHVIGKAVTEAYFGADENTVMGDIFRLARNKVNREALAIQDTGRTDSTNIVNTACYNFIGDPEISLYIPRDKVTVTSVAGSDTRSANIAPLTHFVVEGVVGPDATADASFNGELTIAINDAPFSESATCTEDGLQYTHTATFDQDQIFETRVPVEKGRFSARIMLPTPSRPGRSNRIALYAATPDGGRRAVGSYDGLVVSDLPEGFDESNYSAPRIETIYLNDKSFVNGDAVNGSPTLYAEFAADDNCLSGSSSLMGQSLMVTLDGAKTYSGAAGMVRYNADGSASLKFPMSDIPDGLHSIEVKIRNMAGISSARTIDFTVVNTPIAATLAVEERPASRQATITLSHFLDAAPETTLQITDAAGHTVFSQREVTFPYVWNLRDNDGNEVPQGRYTVKAMLHSGLLYGSATPAEIIIIK